MIKTTTKEAKQSISALSELDARAVSLGKAMGMVPYQYSRVTALKILGLRMELEDMVKKNHGEEDDSIIELESNPLTVSELNVGNEATENNIPPSVLHRLVNLNLLTLKSD